MKKFLQISGIIFWIQITLIIIFLIFATLSSSKYYDELAIFSRSLQAEIFDERDWTKLEEYFAEPIINELNTADYIVKALDSEGKLLGCEFESSITSSFNETVADTTASCRYEENSYLFSLSILRNENSWIVTKARVTSDAFKIGL
ncbi:hypothetical protein [Halopseudomonas salina]|uniref:Uncharacterized protein n=1 Tax=Halopseudomonas salina TaxID=1323744 RepID=A0ABQ1P4X7_9GAMM|nr:hypothetical protein [Halopseudomonas salina]GGC90625.1 hypothetical protein GCM10007418_07960 [Halopseudomonas salina]